MVICILIMVTVSAAESTPMPFGISGYVLYENGSACNNSSVTITDLNTGETFSTITLSSSNYYRVKPVPLLEDEISEGDMLRFNVSAGAESVVIDHRITASEIGQGLHLNISFGEDKIVGIVEQTQTQTPSSTTPTPAALTPTTPPVSQEKKGIPGFEAASAIPGLLAVAYMMRRIKKKTRAK